MPSPIGHALAGLTTAWLVALVADRRPRAVFHTPSAPPTGRFRGAVVSLPAACAVLAVAPDFDLFFSSHRGVSHSLAAAIMVGVAAALVARPRSIPGVRVGVACGLAVGTHVLLDWLGSDSSPPLGVMALWPFSRDYWLSGLDWFPDISRRYWLPEEFIRGNLRSLARELLILVPVTAVAFAVRVRRARSAGRPAASAPASSS